MNLQFKKHTDGMWWTSETFFRDHKLELKMKSKIGSSSAKIHIWNIEETKVLKTFRYSYAKPESMIAKAQIWINNLNK